MYFKSYILLLSLFFSASELNAQQILEINNQREIFVDHYCIDSLINLNIKLHHPHNEGPVLSFDQPWEGHFSGYTTIIKDSTIYRAYYRGLREAGSDGSKREVTCYAESKDGIHWKRPELNLFHVKGTTKNNVILADAAPVTHNFSPFLDQNPRCKPDQRYKALGGTSKSGLVAYSSADGIHWKKLREQPVFTKGVFDSQNVAFWSHSEHMYVCYFRSWSKGDYAGYRTVGRTTSKDFILWSDPESMTFGNTRPEHIYTQQTSPYYRAPHIYLSIGARFMPGRQVLTEHQALQLNVNPKYFKDCSDAFFMTSRGGNRYDRTFMESFIRPGIGLQNWVSRSNYPALNVVQTGPEEMSIYVNENYAQPTAKLQRYSLRIDGFTSLSANFHGGEMISKPLIHNGSHLEINYATSAAGSIKIEIQNQEGLPIPGYSLNDATEIIGNEIQRIVSWKNRVDLSELKSQPIRLRIVMNDADLYSFKFNK